MPRSGFTLIELMVAMVITMIALGLLGRAFLEQQVTYERESEVIEMQSNSKIAMQMMSNEFMLAGFIPNGTNMPSTDVSGGAAEDIEEADTNAFTVIGDVDDDGIIETVRYNWAGTAGDSLTRETWAWTGSAWGVSSDAQELATAIQSLDINYYDGDNNELSTPLSSSDRADVRKIKIDLVSQTDIPDPNLPRTSKLSSEVRPRNLGLVDQNTTATSAATTSAATTSAATTSTTAASSSSSTSISTTSTSTTVASSSSTSTSTTAASTSVASSSVMTTSTTSITSTTSTTTSTTSTVTPTLSVTVQVCQKASGSGSAWARTYVTDGTNPVTGATVTFASTGIIDSGTLTDKSGGYYGGSVTPSQCGNGFSGSNFKLLSGGSCNCTVAVIATATKAGYSNGGATGYGR